MKKLLLSLVALLGLGVTASAAPVEITDLSATTTEQDGYTITADQGTNKQNAPALNSGDLRLYANNTITVSGPKMSGIVFTIASSNSKRYTTVTASTGTVAEQAKGDTQISWEGDATEVTFTVGEIATLGTESTKAGQIHISAITIYPDGETPVVPDPVPDDPVDNKMTSIKALVDATEGFKNKQKTDELELDFAMTVTYFNGKNLYVTDGTDNLLIYGEFSVEGLENGKVIPAGLKGKMTLYNGLPELTDVVADSFGTLTDGTPVEPVETTVADVTGKGFSTYVKLEGVTVSDVDNKGNFKISQGEATVAGYNTFKIASIPEGQDMTIVGIITYYDKYQVAPITITAAGGKEVVAAPTFNPAAGEVEAGTAVTIATTTEGAYIYYTLDGSAPTSASTLYEAPVEVTEAVTIKAIALKEGCDDSEVAEAAYTIKIPADATFNFTKPETLNPEYPADSTGEGLSADGNNMQAIVTDVKFTDGDVTVVNTKGTSTDAKIYYQAAGAIQLRVYNGGSTTITTNEPTIHLSKVVFHYNNGSTSYSKVTAPEEGTWETGTWTVGESATRTVTFAYTGTQQINSIEVYTVTGDPIDSDPEPVQPEATKVASVKALLDANAEVASGDTTEGEFELDFPVTVIYSEGQYNYVTDGTNNLLIYSNLGKTGLENGKVLPAGITGKYKNQNGLPELLSIVAASVGDPTDGTPVEPVATTVEDANAEGISAYVVIEGVTVSNVNGKNFTITDEADNTIAGYNSHGISIAEGENLTVTGFVSIYGTTYQIAPVSITNAQGKETVAAPTFNPESGEVLVGTRVNIYTTTEGASIHYTVDGTEPTAASTLYETAIEITEAVTIKAIAVKEGCDDSEVSEAAYTLKAPADATFNFASPTSLSPAYPAEKEDSSLNADGTSGFYANVSDVKFTNGEDGDITVTNTKGTSTDARLYYQNSGKVQLRVYNGGSTTIASVNDKLVITKVVFTYNNGNTSYNKVVAPAVGTWDKETGTWTAAEESAGVASVKFEYTGTQQINAIEVFTAEASGIDAVAADSDADVEFFNLQGVRVDNPTPGLYIRRQGTEVTKVIVR